MKLAFACAALIAFGAAGCNQVTMVDDVDLTLDFTPLLGPSDALHQPYVQGSSMTLWVESSDHRVDEQGWSIASSDPNVFTVSPLARDQDRPYRASVACHAASAGQATLTIRDASNHLVRVEPIEVGLPDRIELMAHGLLLIGHPDAEADITEARIRAGGTATYLARYFRGSQQLYGNGALSADMPTNVEAQVVQTFLFENRDWLQLSPTQPGNYSVALSTGGTHVTDLPVVAVNDTDVTSLRILGEDESKARRGQWLVALAQAYDTQLRPIYGVDYQWQLGGKSQVGLGDIYRYEYDPRNPNMLSASFGQMEADAMIHGFGYVDSTNNVGCSFIPGLPADRSAPIWAIFFIVAFAGVTFRLSRYRDTSGSSYSPARRPAPPPTRGAPLPPDRASRASRRG